MRAARTPARGAPPAERAAAAAHAIPGAAGRRIGILGGTFNPPHLAHLALARAALQELGLDRVLLVPARRAPHKPQPSDPGIEHRLAMCRLIAADDPRIDVSTIELDRPPPSYTLDTLRSIHSTNPDAELTLILGADMASSLSNWREPREILRCARLAVAERDTKTTSDVLLGPAADAPCTNAADAPLTKRAGVRAALRAIDESANPLFLEMKPLDMSSSQVRARIAEGEPVEQLVGPQVASYIAEQGLYR